MSEHAHHAWPGKGWRFVPWLAAALAVAVGIIAWATHVDSPFVGAELSSPEALIAAADDLDLPTASAAVDERASAAVGVLVTRSELLLAGDPSPIATFPEGLGELASKGFEERSALKGPSAFEIPELGNGLSYRREQVEAKGGTPAVALIADAHAPYRAMAAVLFTATQAGFSRVELAVRSREKLSWIGLVGPWSDVHSSQQQTLFVTEAGFVVRYEDEGSHPHNVSPGCGETGPGIAVPKEGGHAGLIECLHLLHEKRGLFGGATRTVLHASAAVEWQAVIDAVSALESVVDPDTSKAATLVHDLTPHVAFAFVDGVPSLDEAPPHLPAPAAESSDHPPPGPESSDHPPPGDVQVGKAEVSAGTVANATAVAFGMKAGFRRCYDKGLHEDVKMKGALRVIATIGSNGEVTKVEVTGSGLSETVGMCVKARVLSAQFAPPDNTRETVTIAFPATFKTQ